MDYTKGLKPISEEHTFQWIRDKYIVKYWSGSKTVELKQVLPQRWWQTKPRYKTIIFTHKRFFNELTELLDNIVKSDINATQEVEESYFERFQAKMKRLEAIINHKTPETKQEAIELAEWLKGEISGIKDHYIGLQQRLDAWL